MRLSKVKKKNDIYYYAIKSLPGGSTAIYEKIGRRSDLEREYGDAEAFAKRRVEEINRSIEHDVMVFNEEVDFTEKLDDSPSLASGSALKNIGWLYVNEVMDRLGIEGFFGGLRGKRKYDLGAINKNLVVNQILNPGSKRAVCLRASDYAGMGGYDLHQSYRFLTDLCNCRDELQAHLFDMTKRIVPLDTDVMIYDMTNFYCEAEEEDIDFLDGDNILQYGFRKYGVSKENRPNPIVQMGLFVDRKGIPIAFTVERGNAGEQESVLPIEGRIVNDYRHSKFIYCSDAGLNSYAIRFFNLMQGRNYVVTHSIKKTAEKERKLMLADSNWRFKDNDEKASLRRFRSICDKVVRGEELTEQEEAAIERDIIYKAFPAKHKVDVGKLVEGYKGTGKVEMEETVFVTFSAKFYLYQKKVFGKQLARAEDWLKKGLRKKKGQSDPSRFIKETGVTESGEIAASTARSIDQEAVSSEEELHGFYAVATNLDASIREVLAINASRWIVEYCFRILKSFFEARPMYVYTEEHIKGHITVCYEALLVYQIVNALLKEKGFDLPISSVIQTLKNMVVSNHNGKYYKSEYTDSKTLRGLELVFGLKLNKKHYKINRFESD